MTDASLQTFLGWFEHSGGFFDRDSIGFTVFPADEGGRGAVALTDIPEGHTLFTVPRSMLISMRTSSLPGLVGQEEWKRRKLDQGWVGLILCMMWEESQGSSSKWAPYLSSLPSHFDTPMFWSETDLEQLKGTTVVEKLGRDEAELSYNEVLVPAIQSRPDLFLPEKLSIHYTLHQYHVMGSRILSRSFNVEKWESEEPENEEANNSRTMDVDEPETEQAEVTEPEPQAEVEEVEEEEEDDPTDVSMVPMADLLNARYESENAKLFYEESVLKMVSTKPIKRGEQIWNTYGDLPNSELLRRYGHVDLLRLPSGKDGNPGDVVELPADIVVSAASEKMQLSSDTVKERIDWWLEEGGDDVYLLDRDLDIPPALVSLVKLISLPSDEWQKRKGRGKPPKPKLDQDMLVVLKEAITRRLMQYPMSMDDDENALAGELSLNVRHATIVRLGEKTILSGILKNLEAMTLERTKRKRDDALGSNTNAKKSRK